MRFDSPVGHTLVAAAISLGIVAVMVFIVNWSVF